MADKPTKQVMARRRNAAARRERILAEGGRALYVLLLPGAAAALADFEAEGHTATTTVNELLLHAREVGWKPPASGQ